MNSSMFIIHRELQSIAMRFSEVALYYTEYGGEYLRSGIYSSLSYGQLLNYFVHPYLA